MANRTLLGLGGVFPLRLTVAAGKPAGVPVTARMTNRQLATVSH